MKTRSVTNRPGSGQGFSRPSDAKLTSSLSSLPHRLPFGRQVFLLCFC